MTWYFSIMWWRDLVFLHGSHHARCTAVIDKRFVGYCTLQLVTAGSVELFYGDERHLLPAGWLWPANPGPLVRFHAAGPEGWWEHRHLALRGLPVDAWLADGLWPRRPQPVRDVVGMAAWFDEARVAFSAGPGRPWAFARAANLVERILLDLAESRGDADEPGWLRSSRAAVAGGRLDGFDAAATARRLGVGGSTLRRRLRRTCGTSLRELAMTERIRAAGRLLLETSLAVRTVAGRLGYRDPSYFCRQFKARTGLSPAAYRRSRQ